MRSNSTGETRLINRRIDCNSKNVMDTMYVATVTELFNEHHRPVDEKHTNSSKPTIVLEHFLSNNHNSIDIQLIYIFPLELVQSNRGSKTESKRNIP